MLWQLQLVLNWLEFQRDWFTGWNEFSRCLFSIIVVRVSRRECLLFCEQYIPNFFNFLQVTPAQSSLIWSPSSGLYQTSKQHIWWKFFACLFFFSFFILFYFSFTLFHSDSFRSCHVPSLLGNEEKSISRAEADALNENCLHHCWVKMFYYRLSFLLRAFLEVHAAFLGGTQIPRGIYWSGASVKLCSH